MSNKLNIELKQGEDFYRLITIKDANGVAVDITGYSFAADIRRSFSDSVAYLSFSFNISDATGGEVEMTLAKALSTAKTIKIKENFLYDVEMNDTVRTSRIMEGTCSVSPEVTK